jgi:hypothetical protein
MNKTAKTKTNPASDKIKAQGLTGGLVDCFAVALQNVLV